MRLHRGQPGGAWESRRVDSVEDGPHGIQPRVVQDAPQSLLGIQLRARLDDSPLSIERDALLLHLP